MIWNTLDFRKAGSAIVVLCDRRYEREIILSTTLNSPRSSKIGRGTIGGTPSAPISWRTSSAFAPRLRLRMGFVALSTGISTMKAGGAPFKPARTVNG